jgi:hypothetical protein
MYWQQSFTVSPPSWPACFNSNTMLYPVLHAIFIWQTLHPGTIKRGGLNTGELQAKGARSRGKPAAKVHGGPVQFLDPIPFIAPPIPSRYKKKAERFIVREFDSMSLSPIIHEVVDMPSKPLIKVILCSPEAIEGEVNRYLASVPDAVLKDIKVIPMTSEHQFETMLYVRDRASKMVVIIIMEKLKS